MWANEKVKFIWLIMILGTQVLSESVFQKREILNQKKNLDSDSLLFNGFGFRKRNLKYSKLKKERKLRLKNGVVLQKDTSDCGCPNYVFNTDFPNMRYFLNAYWTHQDFTEIYIENWVQYLKDVTSDADEKYSPKKSEFSPLINKNVRIVDFNSKTYYAYWIDESSKSDKYETRSVNFSPQRIDLKSVNIQAFGLHVTDQEYSGLKRDLAAYLPHFHRIHKWGVEYYAKAKLPERVSIYTGHDFFGNYINYTPPKTGNDPCMKSFEGAEIASFARTYFLDNDFGPSIDVLIDRLDEIKSYPEEYKLTVSKKICEKARALKGLSKDKISEVNPLLEIFLKCLSIALFHPQNIQDFIANIERFEVNMGLDTLKKNKPSEYITWNMWTIPESAKKEYFRKIISSQILSQTIDGFATVMAISERLKHFNRLMEPFKKSYQKKADFTGNDVPMNIIALQLEAGNRPIVTQLDITVVNPTLKPGDPAYTKIHSYLLIFSYQFDTYTPQGQNGWTINMSFLKKANLAPEKLTIPLDKYFQADELGSARNCEIDPTNEKFEKTEGCAKIYKIPYTLGTVKQPTVARKVICRVASTAFKSVIEKFAQDLSQGSEFRPPSFCPIADVLNYITSKRTTGYDFNCQEFSDYLQKFMDSLPSAGVDDLFDELSIDLDIEKRRRLIATVFKEIPFKCDSDSRISSDDPKDPSTFGYSQVRNRVVFTLRFRRNYAEKLDENSEEVKRAKLAEQILLVSLNPKGITSLYKSAAKDFEPGGQFHYSAFLDARDEDGLTLPETDFNNMCFNGKILLTQNTQSFMECFKYIPFEESVDSTETLIEWKYRRVLIRYFRVMFPIYHGIQAEYKPLYVLNNLETEINDDDYLNKVILEKITAEKELFSAKQVQLRFMDPRPMGDPNGDHSVLAHFTLNKFDYVPLIIEIYYANAYYLRLVIRTMTQEFEIFIDRYPMMTEIYHLYKTDGLMKFKEFMARLGPRVVNLIDGIDSIEAALDIVPKIRVALLQTQYFPKVYRFLQGVIQVNTLKLLDDFSEDEVNELMTAPPCVQELITTDLVSFPVIAQMTELIIFNSKLIVEGQPMEFEKVADSIDHIHLINIMLEEELAIVNSDKEKEIIPKFDELPAQPRPSAQNADLYEKLKILFKRNFQGHYAVLFRTNELETLVARRYWLVSMQSFETDTIHFLYLTFKCNFFQEDFVIAYTTVIEMHRGIRQIIEDKVTHFGKVIEASRLSIRGAKPEPMPDIERFEGMVLGMFDKIIADTLKIMAPCEKQDTHKEGKNTIIKTYCVKPENDYGVGAFSDVDPTQKVILAVIKKGPGLSFRVYATNLREKLISKGRKGESKLMHSDYYFPFQPIAENDPVTIKHLEQIVNTIRTNLNISI